MIEGTQPDRAIVFYMSENKTKELNGTAFWKHKKYGDSFKDSFNLEEFNRLIKEESNDLDKWELSSVIGHKKNRFYLIHVIISIVNILKSLKKVE